MTLVSTQYYTHFSCMYTCIIKLVLLTWPHIFYTQEDVLYNYYSIRDNSYIQFVSLVDKKYIDSWDFVLNMNLIFHKWVFTEI